MSGATERGPLPAPGTVRRVGAWAVGRARVRADRGTPVTGEVFAVSRVCRHQLADLSKGTVDADGCLVCPWHQSRYDVTDGRMVSGPRGFLGYHGPAPGYSGLIKAYSRVLRLRVRPASVVDGEVELG